MPSVAELVRPPVRRRARRCHSVLALTGVLLSVGAPATAGAAAATAIHAAASDPQPVATQAYAAPGLEEASGLTASVLHPGAVWVSEDSGEPILRAYDPAGNQLGSILFQASDVFGGDNRDTEALAMGPGPTLWSADIGDNNAVRGTVLVHTVPEPAELGDSAVTATSYRFTFPDGARDAEAFLVDPLDGRAYVASKSLLGRAGWYAAPASLAPGETHELARVQDLPALLTDGAFSPDGGTVALRTLGLASASSATLYDVVRHGAGAPVTLAEREVVALPVQSQGESLTFTRDGTALLVGSEGPTEPIWAVPLPTALVGESPAGLPPASTGGVGAAPSPATAAGRERCALTDPTACVSGSTAAVGLVVVTLGVLLAAVAALRRRR